MFEVFYYISVFLIGAIASYLGSLMIPKRMALVGGPLGHLALPGVALALSFKINIFFGALFSIALGVIFIWLFEIKTKLPLEAITGIVFATGVALGFLILPLEKAEEALIGDPTQIEKFDVFLIFVLTFLTFFLLKRIYKKIILIGISEDLAKSQGINPKKYHFLYLFLTSLVVAMEVKIVGILLTAALIVIPASASRNLSKNLKEYTFLAFFLGGLSTFLGTLLAKMFSSLACLLYTSPSPRDRG